MVGWNYLKELKDALLSPLVTDWDSPPAHGISQTELSRSDLWGTCKVKAQIGRLWNTAGWDFPSTPPAVEEVCELFSSGRTLIAMRIREFIVGDNMASTGAHKLFTMARRNLKEILEAPFIVSRTGALLYRLADNYLPIFGSAHRRNLFSDDELEAFRQYHSVFDAWNYTDDALDTYVLSF